MFWLYPLATWQCLLVFGQRAVTQYTVRTTTTGNLTRNTQPPGSRSNSRYVSIPLAGLLVSKLCQPWESDVLELGKDMYLDLTSAIGPSRY